MGERPMIKVSCPICGSPMAAEDPQGYGEGQFENHDRLDDGHRSIGEGESLETESGEKARPAC